MPEFVMVLNDGETWTDLNGCVILKFDEEPTDEEVKRAGISNVVARFIATEDRAEMQTWRLVSTLDPLGNSLYPYQRSRPGPTFGYNSPVEGEDIGD